MFPSVWAPKLQREKFPCDKRRKEESPFKKSKISLAKVDCPDKTRRTIKEGEKTDHNKKITANIPLKIKKDKEHKQEKVFGLKIAKLEATKKTLHEHIAKLEEELAVMDRQLMIFIGGSK